MVHLINPMRNPAGGSEHRTMDLFEILAADGDVQIWSEEEPNPAFLGSVPIQRIVPSRFPRSGIGVFVGSYFSIGPWIKAANFQRVILVQNLPQPERLRQVNAALQSAAGRVIEVVYASSSIAQLTPDLPGRIEPSPIDLAQFHSPNPQAEFVVGRLSRDVHEKHHSEDPRLYMQLADMGIPSRIMGGTVLGDLGPYIEILPENSVPANAFLASLGCFVYRTDPAWTEAYGRVVFEGMAASLPVIVEPRHGYAEFLEDGVDSIFAKTTPEFVAAIEQLRDNSDLRKQIGANARATVERLYGDEYRRRLSQYYFGTRGTT